MRKHRLIACALVLVGTATVGASGAPGEAPGAPSGKPGKDGRMLERMKERLEREHGPHGGKPDSAGSAEPAGSAGPDGKGPHGAGGPDGKRAFGKWRGHGAFQQLLADLRDGKIKREDVKERLAKLRENMAERRAEHQGELKARWGRSLVLPAAREELRLHAQRMARLHRAAFLAETEVTQNKDKLIERINKLIEKEQTRHERAMERFKDTAASAPSAAASAAPAASAEEGAK
jgi:hypothetical protein